MAIIGLILLSLILWGLIGYFVVRGISIGFEGENLPEATTASHSEYFDEGLPIIQGNYLAAMSYLPNFKETQVLGVITSDEESPAETKRNPIIDCLIEKESGGNPKAYNPKDIDGFPKLGLLQFHKPTFQGFCVNGYKLKNDIWDSDIQIKCAELMIRDGFGWHWGAWKVCNQ